MQYAYFSTIEEASYKVCLLVPNIRRDEIRKAYLETSGLAPDDLLVMTLAYGADGKKLPMTEMRRYITEELMPVFKDMGIKYVMVADGEYFKAFTKAAKIEANLGYVLDTDYGVKVVYVPFHTQIFYDPEKTRAKIAQGISALIDHMNGRYVPPGDSIIKFAAYPDSDEDIQHWLTKLLSYPRLTADIEAFSLKHYDAGIGTISFAWNQGEGIAFAIDYVCHNKHSPRAAEADGSYGFQQINPKRRALLKQFFIRARELGVRIMWHNIAYDVYVLIYQLFMEHILDQDGLLEGLEIMLGDTGDWDCTKLITYLATNSCAGNKLGLKDQAQEYSGNYAVEEIKDIRRIPLPDLLQYNLVDSLSTWYVFNKHWNTLIADQQLPVYEEMFQPATLDIVQMQLTGMPVNMKRAIEVNKILEDELDVARQTIMNSPVIKRFERQYLDVEHTRKRNEKLKKKQIAIGDEPQTFNPNSDPQKRALFFDVLKLDVINLTPSKEPSTDGETVEALLNREQDPEIKEMLEAFQLYEIINVLTTNFMPSILGSQQGPDGWHYLFGFFNLGGTLSGRLSSSGPNLQNLPSTGKGHPKKLVYAKLIKSCFQAPPGWLFCGIDFSSLEDRISALTTKDPNKLKVYIDGYDSHSLRAYSYWPDKMPDIDPTSVESINSVQKKYKPLRDRSKNPTFALTYQAQWPTLVKKYNFTPEEAKGIEAKYHELYKVSDAWVDDKLQQAARVGYVTIAFGLRLRTPLLHQVIRGTSKTPFQAEAEGRTAGNALGQSYCLLNTRAGIDFNGRVRKSEFRKDIKPCAQIHDAGYFLIRDDLKTLMFTNEHLVKAVQWQELPEIWHDEVKLGGEFGIFYPSWEKEITIPNNATESEIIEIVDKAVAPKTTSETL